ncbi:protein HESO1 isoform X2 [Phalaenopsis equestris]|uniref:protein HESO1 isoform X2 n=1 Tax=Phalaenopsis equestris TaxID=78828 RepID=UPI0009E18CC6|nr:protein HESO1 isoform X2 [Phalaenopsis equestris]
MAYSQPSDIYVDSQLELCVKEILSFIKPSADDTLKRQNVLKELARALGTDQSLIDGYVRPFGSFISNLYTKWGDLDISFDLTQSWSSPAKRSHKLNVLKKIMRAIERTGVACKIEFVKKARVPIVMYQSKYYNISCDISIDNYAGYIKSYYLHFISDIDERFRELVLLIKEFAKAQQIDDPKRGTLNSYSLCLLIIFHFQTCRPAIFPPLKDLYEGDIVDDVIKGDNTLKQIEDSFVAKLARYKSQISRQRNQSSICQLFISFFNKFSGLDATASNYVISTYTGQWKPIDINNKWLLNSQRLFIEDPFEQTENAARSVDSRGLTQIVQTFTNMYWRLSLRSAPMDRTWLIRSLVRPEIRSMFVYGKQPIHDQVQPHVDWTKQPRGYFASPGSSQHGYVGRWDGKYQS